MAEIPSIRAGRAGITRRNFVTTGAVAAPTAVWGAGIFPREARAAGLGSERRPAAARQTPAFPGAEGAGMYATGGRGGEVYEVTTLDDSGPGSLRDAVSGANRTVVFKVSGNIELQGGLDIIGPNLTIAGQTAPGDGICVSGNQAEFKGNNIIVRHLRFRAGDTTGSSIDTANGRGINNILVDHCSFTWGIDECLSLYGNTNMTVQWCIIGEPLTISAHEKGRHGYGGLWGGDNVTYHHNLLVHNGGRNPRFSFTEGMDMVVDMRNNVIYNHGHTSGYGGEWSNGVNIIGNYYKYGPNTLDSIAREIFAPGRVGQWYVADNYVDGHPDITADNWLGVPVRPGGITKLDEPVKFAEEVATQTAAEAYEDVLANVGATLPRRDAIDARLVNDVRNRTGRMINSQDEVGGLPPLVALPAPADSDHDGIPDDWEQAHGLDPNDPADANTIPPGGGGHTNLEIYLNSITGIGKGNPSLAITSPAINEVLETSGTERDVVIEVDAAAVEGESVALVEFFNSASKIGETTSAPYRITLPGVSGGTYYLTARASDSLGTSTTSSCIPIHVNKQTKVVAPWKSTDIGDVPIPGSAFINNGRYTVKGSGKIKGGADSFHYLYQPLDARPGTVSEMIARVDHLSRPYIGMAGGLMIRESLTPDSPFVFMGLAYTESGKVARSIRMASYGEEATVGDFPWDGELELDQPYWIRLIKRGTEFEGFVSNNSLHWDRVGYERIDMADRLYIGLAVDGGKEANATDHYTVAKFSLVEVNQ